MLSNEKNINNKTKHSIFFMMWGMTLIRFWGLFFAAPTFIKFTYALLIYLAIWIFPFQIIKHKELTKYTKIIIYSLLAVALLQISRSVFNTEEAMYAIGNKWITLFGNEYTSFIFFPPLFIFLSIVKQSPRYIIKATFFYIIICFCMLLIKKNSFAYVSIYLLIFWPFVKTKYKILIIITYLMTIQFALNGARMFFITTFFALAAYFIVYVIKEKFIKLFIITTLGIIPIIFISALFIKDYKDNNESYFQRLQTYITNEKGNEKLGTDTRTFLYVEMAEDLSKTNSWVLGKGALSYYYSSYFDNGTGNKYGRISSEVPFLNFLLRGGIIYTALYFGLLLYAIWCGLKYGKNKFVKSITIIITGWIFNSFVGDITGCTFYHIVFFILAGCCLNKKWLNYTDCEVYKKITSHKLS